MLAFDAMQAFLASEQIDLFRIVHGEQRFAYERPVRIGDVLTATLSVVSLRQIGGADIIGTSSAITDADGALVCTGRATWSTPVAPTPQSRRPHEPRRRPRPARTFAITRADLVAYAEAAGDPNPIHQDEEVARSVGLPGVIAHGMLTLGLVGRAVDEWTGGAEVVELGCKFTQPVVVPAEGAAEVVVAGTVKTVADGLVTLALEVTCGGTKVLGMPKAVVRA